MGFLYSYCCMKVNGCIRSFDLCHLFYLPLIWLSYSVWLGVGTWPMICSSLWFPLWWFTPCTGNITTYCTGNIAIYCNEITSKLCWIKLGDHPLYVRLFSFQEASYWVHHYICVATDAGCLPGCNIHEFEDDHEFIDQVIWSLHCNLFLYYKCPYITNYHYITKILHTDCLFLTLQTVIKSHTAILLQILQLSIIITFYTDCL